MVHYFFTTFFFFFFFSDNKDDDKPTKDLYSEFIEHTDMIKKSIDEEYHASV